MCGLIPVYFAFNRGFCYNFPVLEQTYKGKREAGASDLLRAPRDEKNRRFVSIARASVAQFIE